MLRAEIGLGGIAKTMRCEHCEYRNSWDCEEWRVPEHHLCERFKLDFDTLTERQQKQIQRRLMEDDDRYED